MSTGGEQQDPLQAALPAAFTQPISLPSSVQDISAASSVPPPIPVPTTPESFGGPPNSDTEPVVDEAAWKAEYDSRVAEWRAQNAVARKKAEETREKYAVIRAQEEADAAASASVRQPLPAHFGAPGTEHVSPADARDLVSGESQGHHQSHSISSPPVSISHPSETEHDRWEDVPSVVSSFPSLPSHTSPPSQPQDTPQRTDSHVSPTSKESEEQKSVNAGTSTQPTTSQITRPQPPAVTPLILDATLPVKTRVFALFSSVAINMFLPFVNGVMLGFGEIFARNVIAPWIGWKSVVNPDDRRGLRPRPQPASKTRDELRSRKADL